MATTTTMFVLPFVEGPNAAEPPACALHADKATKLNPYDIQIFFLSLNGCAKAIAALVNVTSYTDAV
ncbi:MAG: hypothetical protein PF904_16350 [Kiritimatiellae bacterium]|jgi:hypothetical protein|nr:hypothetical protein [Kiritimatiellia bacterium]